MQQKDYGTFEYELARRWAPIHWQEINSSSWRADLVTAVDFDGDWKTIGNWDAMTRHPLIPVVYYSVVESKTHWFILYFFYHPRDWNSLGIGIDQHENDIEGLLAVVEKPASLGSVTPHGSLVALVTIAHNHFYSYTNVLEGHHETIDGDVFFAFSTLDDNPHPCTRQEAEGHGCYGLQPTDSREWKDLGRPHEMGDAIARKAFEFPGGRGVRYVPGGAALEPAGYGPVTTHDSPYVLVDMFEEGGFWQRRCAPLDEPFTAKSRLAGRKHEDDKASPPWAWNDKDDSGKLGEGVIATDPITLVGHYFAGFSYFSREYVRNPYRQPLGCDDRRLEHIRATGEVLGLESTAPAARTGRRAIQRRLRAAVDPELRGDVEIGLVQEAERSPRFRRNLVAAARSMIADALTPRRTRRGPDNSVRLHLSVPAIAVVGRLDDRQSRPLLVKILQASSDREVLLATLGALSRLSPGNEPGFKQALVPLLSNGDRDVREAATRLYSQVLARRDPRPLEDLIADPISGVRTAALEGLGKSGRAQYVGDLEEAAADPKETVQVRIAATTALLERGVGRRRVARPEGRATDLESFLESTGLESAPEAAITDTPQSPADYGRFCLERLRQEAAS